MGHRCRVFTLATFHRSTFGKTIHLPERCSVGHDDGCRDSNNFNSLSGTVVPVPKLKWFAIEKKFHRNASNGTSRHFLSASSHTLPIEVGEIHRRHALVPAVSNSWHDGASTYPCESSCSQSLLSTWKNHGPALAGGDAGISRDSYGLLISINLSSRASGGSTCSLSAPSLDHGETH